MISVSFVVNNHVCSSAARSSKRSWSTFAPYVLGHVKLGGTVALVTQLRVHLDGGHKDRPSVFHSSSIL